MYFVTCACGADQIKGRRSCQTCAVADEVAVLVEPASNNARKLYAGVDINAPVSIVWNALTDYDGLGNFIPGADKMQACHWTVHGCILFAIRCDSEVQIL